MSDVGSERDERRPRGARWDSGVPSEELQRVLKEGWIKPCRTLELGCGSGANAVFLASQGFEVTAVDISPQALERVQDRANRADIPVRFLQADVLQLPKLGPPFSFVFDRGCYQHVRAANRYRFQETLAQVTEPGSLYLTLVPNANERDPSRRPPLSVYDYELCLDLFGLFDLVQLREIRMQGRVEEGRAFCPLGWSVLRRRKETR